MTATATPTIPTERELGSLHKEYCKAAGVAEYHIGAPDEEHYWAISDWYWSQYEDAIALRDALLLDLEQTQDAAS